MNAGYVKVHRAILHHWLWDDPRKLRAWLYLLFEASWEPREIPIGDETLTLQRGQLSTTIRKLNGAWGYYSEATLNLLKLFERHDMIKRKSYPSMTVITIVNYDEYQLDRLDAERKPKRKSKHIKEDNNEEEKIIINNPSTSSREDEIEFLKNLENDVPFFESLAMLHHIDMDILKNLFQHFKKYCLEEREPHRDFGDCKNHFQLWLNSDYAIKLRKNNGTGQRKTEDTHSDRRAGDVTKQSAEGLRASFSRRTPRKGGS